MEDIFALSISKKETEFVKSGLELEMDVSADIIETFCDVPYIGSLIKLGMLGSKVQELHFIKKLASFLEKEKDIPTQKKEKFLNSLSPKRRKKMYEYLIHYLLTAEDDEKARIMGVIFCERVYDRINDEMFLRLCSAINKIFVFDLTCLQYYLQPNYNTDYVTNSLYSCGLLDTIKSSFNGGVWNPGGGFVLNAVGKQLYDILSNENWFDKK